MGNDKREQAWAKWERDQLGDWSDVSHRQSFDAGHAAATAEGIPQADGWVAIKSIADLPTVNGRYVTQEWSGILRIQDYDSHRRKLWFSSVLAYLPKPIQPYQRQSSEGAANER